MSARIRGHYRIDATGRIEPMTDVNGSAMKFHVPPETAATHRNSRLVQLSLFGFLVAVLMVGGMFALPKIEQELVAAQSARYASVHHMHGQKRHDAANKLLHDESVADR